MIDEHRLDEVLASIAVYLDIDPAPASAVAPARWWRRWWGRLGIAVAAASVTVLGVSPLRGAVADWLGIGSTQVEVRPDAVVPDSLPMIDDGAIPISPADAADWLGEERFDRVRSTELGEPAGFAMLPEGGVLTIWPDGTTLWVHTADMEPGIRLQKLVSAGEQVQPVADLGDDALVIVGDHVLETPHRAVASGTTVLWIEGDQELRLAGPGAADELIERARDLAAS